MLLSGTLFGRFDEWFAMHCLQFIYNKIDLLVQSYIDEHGDIPDAIDIQELGDGFICNIEDLYKSAPSNSPSSYYSDLENLQCHIFDLNEICAKRYDYIRNNKGLVNTYIGETFISRLDECKEDLNVEIIAKPVGTVPTNIIMRCGEHENGGFSAYDVFLISINKETGDIYWTLIATYI